VKPTYAILSVGDRRIGRLPHPEVLKRYQQVGAKIFRTDKHGAITVVTDGEGIEVKPFLEDESSPLYFRASRSVRLLSLWTLKLGNPYHVKMHQ
jgi:competence protein ComEC